MMIRGDSRVIDQSVGNTLTAMCDGHAGGEDH
jgi:hypothetical protein